MTELARSGPGYRELEAPRALRELVACVWVRTPPEPREVRVVPDGCADLVWRRGEGVSIAGPDTSAKVVRLDAEDLLVGVRLRPGAGSAALGAPLTELLDLRVEAGDLDGRFAVEPERAPAEVVERLLATLADARSDPLVAAATARVEQRQVREVARELGVSERQLRRRFQAAVGYGPKTLTRVLRFGRFVEAVDAGRGDLAALAFEAGYADQAHLTRETRRLAGLPPAAFVAERHAHA